MLNSRRLLSLSVLVSALLFVGGCSSVFKEKKPRDVTMVDTVGTTMTQEEAEAALATGSSNWFFGQGLGDTVVKLGTTVMFPPFALYVLGNTALNAAGYEGIYVTDALPEPYKTGTNELYTSMTSIPGRLTSTVSGTTYKSPEVIAANGGFWGLNKDDNTMLASEEVIDDKIEVASNNLAVRNDLYGDDWSGS